jgi:hypothetical protein
MTSRIVVDAEGDVCGAAMESANSVAMPKPVSGCKASLLSKLRCPFERGDGNANRVHRIEIATGKVGRTA